jgi:ABC-type sugar transport system substrate-binding protein
MRHAIRCALLAIAVAGMLACGRHVDRARPRVALVLKTLNSPFFIDLQKGAEAAAARLDITLVVQAAEREMDVE